MTENQQLISLYKKLFDQKAILTKAPALTLDPTNATEQTFPTVQALTEIEQIIAYLLGLKSMHQVSLEQALSICQKAYATQPYWKDVILDYLDYKNDQEEAALKVEGQKIAQQGKDILEEIQQHETEFQSTVQSYAAQVEKANFPVDAKKLIRNYLNMASYDPEKAYKTLTENPAYFSPIKTQDKNGKQLLSAEQAKEQNKKLAHFLSKLVA